MLVSEALRVLVVEAVLALDANDDDEEKFCTRARSDARTYVCAGLTAPTRAKLRDNKIAGMLWSVGQVLFFALRGWQVVELE